MRLLPWQSCLKDRGCIVGEKRGGAFCRVKIYRLKPDLHCVNGKVIIGPLQLQVNTKT